MPMSAVKKLHGLEQQLCFALYSSSHAMTRRYKPLLSPLGLTYPQYLALLVLFEADQIPVKHLVEKTGLDTGNPDPTAETDGNSGSDRQEKIPGR